MIPYFIIFFVSLSFTINAANAAEKVSTQSSQNISLIYLGNVRDDAKQISDFASKFKKNYKIFCPDYQGPDQSNCLKAYLSSLKIKSSTQVVLLSTIVTDVAQTDQNNGNNKPEILVNMIENLLSIFESMSLSNFYLSEITASNPEEKQELFALRTDDEKMILESYAKFGGALSKKLIELEIANKAAKKNSLILTKAKELKTRIEKLKIQKWKYGLI